MNSSFNVELKNSKLGAKLQAINENKMNRFVVWFFYFAGVVLYFCLSNYDKTIAIYNDEMLYYSLARSIYQGKGLLIHGVDIGFTKIAYSLLIAPFFAIEDVQLRITMIMLCNSLVMMSSIFPAYHIAKEIKMKRSVMYLFLFFFVLWPGLLMSETFMSEVLYFPLVLWFVLFWVKEQRSPEKIIYPILEGIIGFLGYLTKEVFLAVIVTYFLVKIMYPFVSAIVRDGEKKEGFWKTVRSGYSLKEFRGAAIFLAVFVLLYIVSAIVFSGKNFYNNAYSRELSLYNIIYFFYGIIVYFEGVAISTLVFPFVYPIIMFKNTDAMTRKLICFVYCNIAVAIATISYTILINEDVGNRLLRIHLRYISPLLILILLIFFANVFDSDKLSDYFKSHSHAAWWGMFFAVVFSFAFFNGVKDNYIDQYELNWFKSVQVIVGSIAPKKDRELIFELAPIIICAVFLILIIVGHLLIKHKKHDKFYIGFAILLLLTSFVNLYYGHNSISYSMSLNEKDYMEIQNVLGYIDNIPDDEKVMFVYDDFYCSKSYVETFFDHNENSYFVPWYCVYGLSGSDPKTISDVQFVESTSGNEYGKIERIDHIVWVSSNSPVIFSNVEVVPEASGDSFIVCKNLDNTTLYF